MNTMFLVKLGVLLLAVCLMSLQVAQANNSTTNTTNNGCGRTDASALLLPLALAASVLYGWS